MNVDGDFFFFSNKSSEISPFFPLLSQRIKEVWICMEISCGEAVLRRKVSVREMRDIVQRRTFRLYSGRP